jgi:hypothetical protein
VGEASVTFTDVPGDHRFFDTITWAAETDVAAGYADGTFGPTRSVSRQAMAAFLYRVMGEPTGPFPAPPFSDVPAGHPFHDEIAWMASSGVAGGYPDGTFRPTEPVSRQAMAGFLHRLSGEPEGPFPDPGFTDVADTHQFFEEISWLADAGIADGFPDGTFRPADAVSRQTMTVFLYRTVMFFVPFDS